MSIGIGEFADIIEANIKITRSSGNSRYVCYFEYSDIREDVGYSGMGGNGESVSDAINHYIDQIKGRKLVLHAHDDDLRREHRVPMDLTNDIKF